MLMGIDKKKILIVEDEAIVAKDLQLRLESQGFLVPKLIDNGPAAIQYLEDHSVDLILMDIHLKGDMDGIQAATKINESELTPIIYLTAFSELETVKEATKSQPFGYIVKPYDEQALFIQIEVALYKFETELAVRNREKWFNTILANLRESVITADQEGVINYVNQSAIVLIEETKDQLIGKPIKEVVALFDEEGRAFNTHPIDRSITKGVSTYSETIMLKTKSGHLQNVECNISPLKDQSQKIVGILVVLKKQQDTQMFQQEFHGIHHRMNLGNQPNPPLTNAEHKQ